MLKLRPYLITFLFLVFLFFYIFLAKPSFLWGPYGNSCLSLTFDDGLASHYNTVYPLLKQNNYSATFFIVANLSEDIYGRELMTKEQIIELSEKGFEIGSHTLTHPHLTNLNEEEIESELKYSKDILQQYGIVINSVAFPYGKYDEAVLDIAKKHYINARVIYNHNFNGFFINSFGLKNDIGSDVICDYIDYAKENNLWFILVLHDVVENPSVWDTSIEDFEEILECTEKVNITVDSLAGCRDKMVNYHNL